MAQANKTFRIFVSSTFDDLKDERNALQKYVFPRLRDLCMQQDCRFQAIDLRWGVSEEAGRDQQTMKICLEEIARCQKTRVRPNFIVLLGDRYGWCPLPSEIPKIEFDQIIEKIIDDDRKLITQWYMYDENALPHVYCLKEREVNIGEDAADDQKKAAQENESEEWRKTETELRLILIRAIDQLGWQKDDPRRVKYEASATEQEINQGALKPDDAQKHVFCFFRKINEWPQGTNAQDFFDVDNNGKLDNISQSKLSNLKMRLSEQLPGNVSEYNANWTDKGLSKDHIGTLPEKLEDCLKLSDADTIPSGLCVDVWRKLSTVIKEEVAQFEDVDALEKEIDNHNEFGKERARFFVGRDSTLKKISDYLKGTDTHPLAVFGVSGSGKSALMARAFELIGSEHKDAEVIVRFIGATPESSDGRALLESLCRQISREYGADESSIPNDYMKLVEELPKRLSLATSEKPLFIFLDALDQLSNTDNANSLIWIPRELPPHVHLVVSTLNGEEKNLPSSIKIELEKMLHKDGNELLDLWLKDAKRSLQEDQKKEILNKFEKSGLPLYLKLAFEEARRWKSYDGIPLGSNGKQGLSQDVSGIIRDMFSRLSSESNHGNMLVSRSMGYLAASKNGLTEDEMLDVFSEDDELYQDFLRRARHTPSEKKLPVVIWSRLYFDLEPYLTQRSADGTSLMAFFHRQLGEVVFEDYLKDVEKKERHRILAEYFGKKPYWVEIAKIRSPNIRKVSEQPYQQAHAGIGELVDTLTDFSFIESKLHALEISSLINDYDLVHILGVREKVKRSEKSLRLIQGALRLSAHVLAQDKMHLRSQLYGRLISQEAPEIRNILDQIRQCNTGCWLRPLTASLMPPGGPLIRTLQGHTDSINAVTVMPDGSRVISASSDKTLKVWDLATGQELQTLKGHNDWVYAIAVTPDGSRAISASRDKTLKVWDIETGDELQTLQGHNDWVYTVVVTPDGSRVISASADKTLKVWDMETWKELQTLNGHTDSVYAIAVTPDGSCAISASRDQTLKVWDMKSGEELQTLKGHNDSVYAVAVTPDGCCVISASRDQTLKVWDMEIGKELQTLKGHNGSVRAIAVTLDGCNLISVSEDETVKVWDMKTGENMRTMEGHTQWICGIAVTPDGRSVISASHDKMLKVWDMEIGEKLQTLRGPQWIWGVAVTPDGSRAISTSNDNTLKIWDMKTGEQLQTLKGHKDVVKAVVVTPDGSRAISASHDSTLKIWDLKTGEQIKTLKHTKRVLAVAVVNDGSRVISASQDKTLKVWDMETGKELQTLKGHDDSVRAIAVTPDGRRAISASADKTLKVWDMKTGEELKTLKGHTDSVYAVTVTPDGCRVISASSDKTLKIWDIETGEELQTLEGHTDLIRAVVVMADGQHVISASADKTLKIWDMERMGEFVSFSGEGSLLSCVVSPDDKTIVAAGSSGKLHFLRLEGMK